MLPDKKNELKEKIESVENHSVSYTLAEGNLQKHHYASLGSKSKEKQKLVSVVEETSIDKKSGVRTVNRWKVIGGGEYGLPTWLDKKVLVAVIDIARTNSFPVKNPIALNISDLCRRVNLTPESGRNRTKVRNCLLRISDTNIEAKGAFYYKELQANVDDRFTVFQRVHFAQATLEDGTKASRTLVWLSEKILSNINHWHIVPVDTKFFMKLVPIAGRLYEILANRFFGLFMNINRANRSKSNNCIIETYEDLCKKMPLTARKYQSRAKEQFHKAHKQLLNEGFLARVVWMTDNRIKYYPGEKAFYDFDNAQGAITQQMSLPFDPKEIVAKSMQQLNVPYENLPEEGITLEIIPDNLNYDSIDEEIEIERFSDEKISPLTERNVSKKRAIQILVKYNEKNIIWEKESYSTIEFYCEFYDWALKHLEGDKKPKSGAWLCDAIENSWFPPNEFQTRKQLLQKKERQKTRQQNLEVAVARQKEEQDRLHYFKWLKSDYEKRWQMGLYTYRSNFYRQHKRYPSPEEIEQDREKYLGNPESPEAYQLRMYKEVKFPLELPEKKD